MSLNQKRSLPKLIQERIGIVGRNPGDFIYECGANSQWCMEELSETDSSFEVLDHLRSSTPTDKEQIKEVERQIAQSDSTALKGNSRPPRRA